MLNICSWNDSLVGQLITLLIDTTAVSDDGVSEQNHQEYNWERPKRMEWIDARKDYDAWQKQKTGLKFRCFVLTKLKLFVTTSISCHSIHVNFLTFAIWWEDNIWGESKCSKVRQFWRRALMTIDHWPSIYQCIIVQTKKTLVFVYFTTSFV